MIDLNPCPVCGAERKNISYGSVCSWDKKEVGYKFQTDHFVKCNKCGFKISGRTSPRQVVETWNNIKQKEEQKNEV